MSPAARTKAASAPPPDPQPSPLPDEDEDDRVPQVELRPHLYGCEACRRWTAVPKGEKPPTSQACGHPVQRVRMSET